MNILFVSALLPYPLYSGGQIRIYNLLKHLGSRHTITLCSFIRNEEEKQWISKLSFCNRIETVYRGRAWQPRYIATAMFSTYPFLFATYTNPGMSAVLRELLAGNSYDIIHLEPGYVWPSVPKTAVPVIVAEHNIEHSIYKGYAQSFPFIPVRPFLLADVAKLRHWERYVWKHASHVVAVSTHDKDEIAKFRSAGTVTVVPNGVDTHSITPRKKEKRSGTTKTFLFVGNFSWIQNRDAVRWLLTEIWPVIHRQYPHAVLRIVGRGMPEAIRPAEDNDSVLLLENVEDIREEYATADVLLAPLRIGGGTKFKVLEAMAAGIPVLTTGVGAEGLDVSDGEHLTIASTPEEFLHKATLILTNQPYVHSVIRNARLLVEKSYDWDMIATKLERVWHAAYETQH